MSAALHVVPVRDPGCANRWAKGKAAAVESRGQGCQALVLLAGEPSMLSPDYCCSPQSLVVRAVLGLKSPCAPASGTFSAVFYEGGVRTCCSVGLHHLLLPAACSPGDAMPRVSSIAWGRKPRLELVPVGSFAVLVELTCCLCPLCCRRLQESIQGTINCSSEKINPNSHLSEQIASPLNRSTKVLGGTGSSALSVGSAWLGSVVGNCSWGHSTDQCGWGRYGFVSSFPEK